jgi:hypothetical protein
MQLLDEQRLLNQARDIKKQVVYAIVKWLLGNKKLK